jgi:hypothetical protein
MPFPGHLGGLAEPSIRVSQPCQFSWLPQSWDAGKETPDLRRFPNRSSVFKSQFGSFNNCLTETVVLLPLS